MCGYIVLKVLYRQDIRQLGSRNVGARNAGTLHGKTAFILTFLGDALKGVLVIVIARFLHFSEHIQLIGLALAVIGHLKPITLKFKGGKGISTFIGGGLAFQPLVAPVILAAFSLLYPWIKSFTLAGLAALLSIPACLFIMQYDWISCTLVVGILLLIFLAHAENIKERIPHL